MTHCTADPPNRRRAGITVLTLELAARLASPVSGRRRVSPLIVTADEGS